MDVEEIRDNVNQKQMEEKITKGPAKDGPETYKFAHRVNLPSVFISTETLTRCTSGLKKQIKRLKRFKDPAFHDRIWKLTIIKSEIDKLIKEL
jgi:hypothetical protein